MRKIAPLFHALLVACGLPMLVASLARADESASVTASCASISNCSFETGALPAWIATDVPSPSFPIQVGGAGINPGNGLFTSAPTDGNFAALHGFNGAGPGTISIVQDVVLPTGANTVTFDYRAGWDMLTFPGSTQARTFIVELQPNGGGAPITSQVILSAEPGTKNLDTGNLSGSLPVGPFEGQTVRIVFRWYVPENNTGPAFFQLDNVGLTVATGGNAPTLYGCSKAGSLFTIDLTTANATYVGTLPLQSTEIEFDPTSQRAFVQAPDWNYAGQEFNIDTGAGIGSPINNAYSFTGLEWVGSTLYGTAIQGPCASSTLRILNPWTGTSTLVGATGVGPISGLAYHQPSGTMYGIAGCNPKTLYTINLSTGATTAVGVPSFDAGSLEFGPDGYLYGGGTGSYGGNLYRINRLNGSATLVGATGFPDITGLTLRPTSPGPDCADLVWSIKAPFNDPRASGAGIEDGSASLISGKIYVSHGYRLADRQWLSAYDIASNTWTHGGLSYPGASVARSDLAAGPALGKHFAIGGRSGMATVEEFDPLSGSWSMRAPLSVPRGGLGAATWTNAIYAIGGRSGADLGQGIIYGTNEVYHPLANNWTTLAPMLTPVSDIQATIAYSGRIFVFGGMDGSGVKSDVQIYNVAANNWTAGAPMPTPRAAAMAGVINGMIAVFGGFNGTSNVTTTELYDPVANTWSSGPNMPVALSEMAQGVTYDSKGIYAIGSGPFGASGTTVLMLRCIDSAVGVPGERFSGAFEVSSTPNPSHGDVEIHFSLPQPTPVACEIVDVTGRRVWGTAPRPMPAGLHTLSWDGTTRAGPNAAHGVYFVRLMTGYGVRTAKIVRAN